MFTFVFISHPLNGWQTEGRYHRVEVVSIELIITTLFGEIRMATLSRFMLVVGVSLLGGFFNLNAEASIVSTVLSTPIIVNNDVVGFDVDNDGFDDLHIDHLSGTSFDDGQTDTDVLVYATYGVANVYTGGLFADNFTLPFSLGSVIDAASSFDSCGCGTVAASNYFDVFEGVRTGNFGYWANGGADSSAWPGLDQGFLGYLGFAFDFADGSLHYGWAQIGVKAYNKDDLSSFEVSVYGYGYETQDDVGIGAGYLPEPSTLALFAIGAIGYWPRKNRLL